MLGDWARCCKRLENTGDDALEHVSSAVVTITTVLGCVRQGDQEVNVEGWDDVCSLSIILFRTVLRAL